MSTDEWLEQRLANRRTPDDPDYDAFYDATDVELTALASAALSGDPAPFDIDQLQAHVAHSLIVGTVDERTEAVRDLLEGWYAAWPETAVTDEHEPLAALLVRLFGDRLARVERERDKAHAARDAVQESLDLYAKMLSAGVAQVASLTTVNRILRADAETVRAEERAEIARQIAELADNETALLGWLSTCNPQPITVPTVLRALAGMIGAGQPAAAADPEPERGHRGRCPNPDAEPDQAVIEAWQNFTGPDAAYRERMGDFAGPPHARIVIEHSCGWSVSFASAPMSWGRVAGAIREHFGRREDRIAQAPGSRS